MKTLPAHELDDLMAQVEQLASVPLADLDFPAKLLDDFDLTAFTAVHVAPLESVRPAAPTGPPKRTAKISLRVPGRTLVAFKERAAATGSKYQSLMIEALRAAAASWEAPTV